MAWFFVCCETTKSKYERALIKVARAGVLIAAVPIIVVVERQQQKQQKVLICRKICVRRRCKHPEQQNEQDVLI